MSDLTESRFSYCKRVVSASGKVIIDSFGNLASFPAVPIFRETTDRGASGDSVFRTQIVTDTESHNGNSAVKSEFKTKQWEISSFEASSASKPIRCLSRRLEAACRGEKTGEGGLVCTRSSVSYQYS